jgi:1-acyl-sn-glycerol-3-phosphate acyltransferase
MPDIKPQVYKDERPAEEFAEFHERSRTKEPNWVYGVVRVITSTIALLFYRLRAYGRENVPSEGPVILAPNHASNMDHFFCGVYLRQQIRFMAKSQLFKQNPVLTFIYTHGGVFPIRRGQRDEEAFKTANAILERGGCMLMYPEGGRSRTPGELGEPKPGIGRIALESGAPVVPVAIINSDRVRRWRKFDFPTIRVSYGEPMSFPVEKGATRERHQEVSEEIFSHVRRLHADLKARYS